MRAGGIHWAATMDAKGFQAGARRVRAEVQSTQKELSEFQRFNDSLKGVFGRGSTLKESLEILAGGGAIAGIGIAARGFKNLSESLRDAAEAFQSGAKSASTLFGEFLTGMPIIGDTASALKALFEVGGMAAGLKTPNQIKAEDLKQRGKFVESERITAATEDIRKSMEREAQMLAARNDAEKERVKIQNQADDEADKINKLREDALANAKSKNYGVREFNQIEEQYRQLRFDSDKNRVERERVLQRKLDADAAKADAEAAKVAKERMEKDAERARKQRIEAQARDDELDAIFAAVEETDRKEAAAREKEQQDRRDAITDRARSMFGEWSSAADRSPATMLRGSAAALSAISANSRSPLQMTVDLMRELVRIAKEQLRAEQEQARAWDETAVLEGF